MACSRGRSTVSVDRRKLNLDPGFYDGDESIETGPHSGPILATRSR